MSNLETKRSSIDEIGLLHDLKAPLIAILGLKDAALLATNEADLREHLHEIGLVAQLAFDFVAESLCRSDAQTVDFTTHAVDLKMLLDQCQQFAIGFLGQSNRRFRISVGSRTPQVFLSNATAIRRIITNLLSNAIKYAGASDFELRVRKNRSSDYLLFSVIDYGPGLTDAARLGLTCVSPSKEISNGELSISTGIGLAVCQILAARIGGKVVERSRPGHSTKFTLYIPLMVGSSATLMQRPQPLSISNSGAHLSTVNRVLIVDDNSLFSLVLKRRLEAIGQFAEVCCDESTAKAALCAEKYDLLIVDFNLEQCTGIQLIEQLRSMALIDPEAKIIGTSAHIDAINRKEYIKNGFTDVVEKSVIFEFVRDHALMPL